VTAARDLEADKNEFMALMTYDLRQPITTILGYGATLETSAADLDTARIGHMGASIRRQADRMSRLADDLYDISRLEARSLLLSPRPVNLADVVRASLMTIDRGNEVIVDVDDALEVVADERRLEQVLANLVDNAFVYGATPVEVRAVDPAHSTDAWAEVSVVDHGPGVPEVLVPTLFNRLRLLSERDRAGARSGTGLGLSLVKGLLEAMGGRVRYQAAPGGGADFRIALPRRP
jgi:signal transduction histidine kinase